MIKLIGKILNKILNEYQKKDLVLFMAKSFNLDLFTISLNQIGILNYKNEIESGEFSFLNSYLISKLSQVQNPVLFDVGANIGKYSKSLFKAFPNANIYTFEPNPNAYLLAENNIQKFNTKNIKLFPLGFSSTEESKMITVYESQTSSSHGSLHSEVLTEFHHSNLNSQISANFTTLDSFCINNQIDHIDLLKIDTEGHELEVLKGAKQLIQSNKIKYIQFEFGECHVYSKVFLRDFYHMLVNYSFYRLLPDKLMPLGEHSPNHEIFRFQNIIAVRNG